MQKPTHAIRSIPKKEETIRAKRIRRDLEEEPCSLNFASFPNEGETKATRGKYNYFGHVLQTRSRWATRSRGFVRVYRNKFPRDALLLVPELVTECNSFYFTLARDEGLHFSRVARMGEREGGSGARWGPSRKMTGLTKRISSLASSHSVILTLG